MKFKIFLAALILLGGFALGFTGVKVYAKYRRAPVMEIAVTELSNFDYPDDPASLSTFYERYSERTLNLIQKDATHFDFIFTSSLPYVATIEFSNVDLSLFMPTVPEWIKGDRSLEIITLSDREWNRQQIRFDKGVTIKGGDGFEKEHITSAELARNCLNAGLWEILLYTTEKEEKKLFYHGWFTFPLGHYASLFKHLNALPYWRDFYRLEHWLSPAGKWVAMKKIRTVLSENTPDYNDYADQRIIAEGEQAKKLRTIQANPVIYWKDFPLHQDAVRFATFVVPGYYSVKKKWKNSFERIATLQSVTHRTIRSPADGKTYDELELTFNDARFIVGGIILSSLPQLTGEEYPEGLYMPMGISVPPFYETYSELAAHPPKESSYYALLLDKHNRWLDHHKIAIDGPVLYRDKEDPNLVHLYFLSYERHTLVAHYGIYLHTGDNRASVSVSEEN